MNFARRGSMSVLVRRPRFRHRRRIWITICVSFSDSCEDFSALRR